MQTSRSAARVRYPTPRHLAGCQDLEANLALEDVKALLSLVYSEPLDACCSLVHAGPSHMCVGMTWSARARESTEMVATTTSTPPASVATSKDAALLHCARDDAMVTTNGAAAPSATAIDVEQFFSQQARTLKNSILAGASARFVAFRLLPTWDGGRRHARRASPHSSAGEPGAQEQQRASRVVSRACWCGCSSCGAATASQFKRPQRRALNASSSSSSQQPLHGSVP